MKMVLIAESGIHIEDDQGFSIGFASTEETLKYSEVDLLPLVGKQTVTYEPRRGIHTWFDGLDTEDKPIPFPVFEDLIRIVKQLKTRKADQFFGLPQAEKDKIIEDQEKAIEKAEKEARRQELFEEVKEATANNPGRLNSIPQIVARLEVIERILGIRDID